MKFLIVRLGAMGDIVHAIPVAVALRHAYPDAQIDWLVSARHREVLDLVPVLNRRIVINDRGGATDGLSIPAAIRHLRRERYDVALDLQGLLKSAILARLSGARRVIGFNRRYAREALASAFYTDVHDPGGEGWSAPSETRHVVDLNLGLLAELGITSPAVEFAIDAPRSSAVAAAIEQAGAHFVLLNTGGGWPNKRWPPDRLAAVATALRERHGLSSIVLWGPGERALADAVAAGAPGAAFVAPETSIADVVSFEQAASAMVSGDTGPTHLASAVGTPLVGLYGPTRPERNGPLGPNAEAISRAAVCQCHHLRRCRLDCMCLLDIEVPDVLAAVERRLDVAGRRG